MSSSPRLDDREELIEAVTAAVTAAIERRLHVCVLGITPELKEDVQGALHDIRQMGQGSLGKGLSEMNENHRWISSVRKKSEKASWAFTAAIIGIVAAGSVGVFIAGVLAKVKSP